MSQESRTTSLPGQLKQLKERVRSLYNSKTSVEELRNNVKLCYSNRADFDDPLVKVSGSVRLLYIQFVMLRLLFSSFWSIENHALFDPLSQTLLIDHTVYYRLFWFLPLTLSIRTYTLLELEKRKPSSGGKQGEDDHKWVIAGHSGPTGALELQVGS